MPVTNIKGISLIKCTYFLTKPQQMPNKNKKTISTLSRNLPFPPRVQTEAIDQESQGEQVMTLMWKFF